MYFSQLDQLKGSNQRKAFGIGQSEGYHLPSGQGQTARVFVAETEIDTALLVCPITTIVLS